MKKRLPDLSEKQISQLKNDIKIATKNVKPLFPALKPSPLKTTTVQNEIAKALGVSSFAEIPLSKIQSEKETSFSLFDFLEPKEISDAFFFIYYRDGRSVELPLKADVEEKILKSKEESFKISEKDSNSGTPKIQISDLYELINESDYADHHYKLGDGFPNEFDLNPNVFFFRGFEEGDHIMVVDGDAERCYTITKYEHIYTKKTVFKVISGRWVNIGVSPFCVGDK